MISDIWAFEYAGVPLSLLGVAAYGAVSVLGFWGLKNREGQDSLQKWLLLGCTSAMAVASAYFMYILTSKLEGASCTYCVSSALLSLSLLLATLRVRGLLSSAGSGPEFHFQMYELFSNNQRCIMPFPRYGNLLWFACN